MAKTKVRPAVSDRGNAKHIRTLRHGDPIPEGEPRRYINSQGYYRLRWKVGKRRYVEAYEHRVVMGLPPDDLHVHHVNEDKTDNRAENLRVLSPCEHLRHHQADPRAEEIAEMYESGMGMVEIAEETGLNHGAVSRIVRREGVETRGNPRRPDLDEKIETIRFLHARGLSAPVIGRAMGASGNAVRLRLKRLGLSLGSGGWKGPEKRAAEAEAIKEAKDHGLL